MVTRAVPCFCRLCGGELGVNEKLMGATAHAKCPAADRAQSAEAPQAEQSAPRRYVRVDGQQPSVRPAKVGDESAGPAKYTGALFASNVLRVVGWIVAFLTPVIAIAAASSYQCQYDLFGQCSDSDVTGTRIALFGGIMVVGWLYAAIMLAIGYAVLLLSDIEFSSRARQS